MVHNDEDLSKDSLLRTIKRPRTRPGKNLCNARLTPRELEVLGEIARGKGNREIGVTFKIGVATVKERVQNVLHKLDVADRTQAAVYGVQHGLFADK